MIPQSTHVDTLISVWNIVVKCLMNKPPRDVFAMCLFDVVV